MILLETSADKKIMGKNIETTCKRNFIYTIYHFLKPLHLTKSIYIFRKNLL